MLRDLLVALNLDALADVLTRWLQGQAGCLPASRALDGRTIRDHLGCIVSLVEREHEQAGWLYRTEGAAESSVRSS